MRKYLGGGCCSATKKVGPTKQGLLPENLHESHLENSQRAALKMSNPSMTCLPSSVGSK